MLGRLVAWLRIFDYDTLSALELQIEEDEDRRLVDIALQDGRVLLTRDRGLVERAKKAGAIAILISPDKVTDQLCELIKHVPINTQPVMERCTVCNAGLRRATAEDIRRTKHYVPEHLVEEGKEFWICERCGKIYWMGSHWRNIMKTSSEIDVCRK
ncbi:conserved hypothetical protein [Methanocella arvoryzae MRE50]|uniref:Mut7-C RNAse domain-containing protein n=2 Tax=Methanocella TaxID=570266 RepID=Q0W128_METAR|nr:conserved hypothetical protein [Methanocella arvoryzae MRE50]